MDWIYNTSTYYLDRGNDTFTMNDYFDNSLSYTQRLYHTTGHMTPHNVPRVPYYNTGARKP